MNSAVAAKTVLIIGATGGLGRATARAFLMAGWQVRALTRQPIGAAPPIAGLEAVQWVAGDAMSEADVVRAAQGASCIFHGANPPNYQRWRELALPMLKSSIAAARASGARLLFPGNVYNFGPDAGQLLSETSPQHPRTNKGRVRVEMETLLQEAAAQGVRSLVLRAGDFFGGYGPSSWFTTVIVKAGRPLTKITMPGDLAVGHSWAYLPDLARTFVQVAEREAALSSFEVFHFAGHWAPRNQDFAEAIRRVSTKARLPIKAAPWLLIQLLSPFIVLFKELLEMRYLWREPLQLDNRKLQSLLGAEPHTPLDTALRDSLIELGCLAS